MILYFYQRETKYHKILIACGYCFVEFNLYYNTYGCKGHYAIVNLEKSHDINIVHEYIYEKWKKISFSFN